jgi:quercetin dioxygenase-like cupin family protein
MSEPPEPECDDRPVSFVARPAPAGMAVHLVSIAVQSEVAYEPSDWIGALVVVEAGEIELECHSGACARFGAGSVLFFEGLPLRTVRNAGRGPALLSAVNRCGQHSRAQRGAKVMSDAPSRYSSLQGGLMAQSSSHPHGAVREQARTVWFLGQPLEIKVTGEQTGGAYAVTEAIAAPGFGPAPHTHRREAEGVYVIEGELRFTVDESQIEGPAGTFVHIPKGSTHSWTSVGPEPAKVLTTYTPAGFEKLFETLGEPIIDPQAGPTKRLDLARLREAGLAYGLEIPDRP